MGVGWGLSRHLPNFVHTFASGRRKQFAQAHTLIPRGKVFCPVATFRRIWYLSLCPLTSCGVLPPGSGSFGGPQHPVPPPPALWTFRGRVGLPLWPWDMSEESLEGWGMGGAGW